MDLGILLVVFILGLFLGSFYNVVGLRTLTGEDLVADRSQCPVCKHKLGPLDLIPVFSYLFLRGRCRYCKTKISYIYPLGEILTALSYSLIIYRFGFTKEALIQLLLITIMIFSTVTDFKEQIVPDIFILVGLVLVGGLRLIFRLDILPSFLGGLGAFAVLYLVFILSGGRMGGADVKIYSLIGLSIGFYNSMLSLFYGSCLALVVYLIMLALGRDVKGRKIPFIPYITGGILLTYLFDIYRVLEIIT